MYSFKSLRRTIASRLSILDLNKLEAGKVELKERLIVAEMVMKKLF